MQTYIKKNKKMIKKIFFIPAAIVGIGVLSITVGGMACMGGAVFVCCIVKSSCECVLDIGADVVNSVTECISHDINDIQVAHVEFIIESGIFITDLPVAFAVNSQRIIPL